MLGAPFRKHLYESDKRDYPSYAPVAVPLIKTAEKQKKRPKAYNASERCVTLITLIFLQISDTYIYIIHYSNKNCNR